MHKKLQTAVRVPVFRVAMLAMSLMVLPSFSINARNLGSSSTVSTPMGAETAEAQAAGVVVRKAAVTTTSAFDMDEWDDDAIGAVDEKVFKMGLGAARCAVKNG